MEDVGPSKDERYRALMIWQETNISMREAILKGIENYIHKSSSVILEHEDVQEKNHPKELCEVLWSCEWARGAMRERQQYWSKPGSWLCLKSMLCADMEEQKLENTINSTGRASISSLHFPQVVGTQLPIKQGAGRITVLV